jgi:asparaginyl-tRNA synthetase
MTTGSSVRVCGVLMNSPAKGQRLELQVDAHQAEHSVHLVGACDGKTYPLQKKSHSVEFLRSIPHLRGRSNLMGAVLRLRNALSMSVHSTLQEAGCLHVHTPILTSNDCEGAGELFAVDCAPSGGGVNANSAAAGTSGGFFGRQAYLTVSGQLHAEAFAVGAGPVYTFGPTFRAEESNTSRHLSEFWMVEPELPWAGLEAGMCLAELVVKRAVQDARERCSDDLHFCGKRVDTKLAARLGGVLPEGGDASAQSFARMTYQEAIAALKASNEAFAIAPQWGQGLATEHEKWLCEQYVCGPVFITDYPAAAKAFYMLQNGDEGPSPDGRGTVACMDLLVPKMAELIGGSAREHREGHLLAAMGRAGLLSADGGAGDLQWYVDLRRYGSVPHAGWGLGFERLVQFVSGVDNIRDAIPVPRAPGLCPM